MRSYRFPSSCSARHRRLEGPLGLSRLILWCVVPIFAPWAHASLEVNWDQARYVSGSYDVTKLTDTSIQIDIVARGAGTSNAVVINGNSYLDCDEGYPEVAEYVVGVLPSGQSLNLPYCWSTSNVGVAHFVDCWVWNGTTYVNQGNSGVLTAWSFVVTGAPHQIVTINEAAFFFQVDGVYPGGLLYGTYMTGSVSGLLQGQPVSYQFGEPAPPRAPHLGDPRNEKIRANYVADPVNVTNGSFYNSQVDLRVNGPMPIEVRRTYSSRNSAKNEFGYAWLGGYASNLVIAPDASTIEAADTDGSVVLFRQVNSNVWRPNVEDNLEFSDVSSGADNLLNSVISKVQLGYGTTHYQWQLPDGSLRDYVVRQFPITSNGTDYTGDGAFLATWTDNRGNSLTFTYGTNPAANDYGQINLIQSSSGGSVSFAYSPGRFVTRATASDGRAVNYTYAGPHLTGVQLPDGSAFAYEYGGSGPGYLLRKETKPDGRILWNMYDIAQRVSRQMAAVDPARPGLPVTTAVFDYGFPGRTTVNDAYGRATVYEYTGNRVIKVTDPLGQTVVKTWYSIMDPANGAYLNALHSVTDQRGLVTTYRYDALGNRVQSTITGDLDGDPATTNEIATSTAAYDSLNRLLSATDASGITSEYTYADASYPYLPTQVVAKQGATTLRTDSLEYTSVGSSRGLLSRRRVAVGTSDEAETEYTYNTAGLLTQQTAHTGTTDPNVVTAFAYNDRRELTSTTDADGRSMVYTYDGMSRPTSKTVKNESGATIGIWTTVYTGNGEVAQIVGPRTGPADSVSRTYDGAVRLQQEVASRSEANADGSGVVPGAAAIATYTHDLFGNRVLQVDPRGNATVFTHDAIGQMLTRTTAGLRAESFQYEPGGNV